LNIKKISIVLASSNNRSVPSSSSSQQQRQNGDKDKKAVKDVRVLFRFLFFHYFC
jgi:hypothetical protein